MKIWNNGRSKMAFLANTDEDKIHTTPSRQSSAMNPSRFIFKPRYSWNYKGEASSQVNLYNSSEKKVPCSYLPYEEKSRYLVVVRWSSDVFSEKPWISEGVKPSAEFEEGWKRLSFFKVNFQRITRTFNDLIINSSLVCAISNRKETFVFYCRFFSRSPLVVRSTWKRRKA